MKMLHKFVPGEMRHKFVPGAVVVDRTLGARQVRVVASDPSVDRDGDVLLSQGCDLSAFAANPVVQVNHDRFAPPVGTAKAEIANGRVEALIEFAPAGVSARADECCGLAKSGVLRGVSVGFIGVDAKPRDDGRGLLFSKWQLVEISLVNVAANVNARVIERSFTKAGRAISAANAGHVMAIGQHLAAIADHHDQAAEHVEALKAAADDGDAADPENAPDEELAFLAAHLKRARRQGLDPEAARRRRLIEIAKMRWGPLPSAEAAAIARMRLVERARRGP
jgi:HK97 family phage prohead protease